MPTGCWPGERIVRRERQHWCPVIAGRWWRAIVGAVALPLFSPDWRAGRRRQPDSLIDTPGLITLIAIDRHHRFVWS
jgi:hypothetical protein